MLETSKKNLDNTTIALVGLPLTIAFALAIFSDSEHLDLGPWVFGFGAAISMGLLLLRLRRTNTLSIKTLLNAIVDNDMESAFAQLRQYDMLDRQSEAALDRMIAKGQKRAESLKLRAEQMKVFGDLITHLGQTTDHQAHVITELHDLRRDHPLFRTKTLDAIEDLSTYADESASSIIQMVTINNEMMESVHTLSTSVDETSVAIEAMTQSARDVARNVEELSTATEETAASMNEMDLSISQVEANATETSALSEQVSQDAETGVAAITHTIEGIDKIKESSRIASEVITSLGQQISQIGHILNVIDEVAEQTNLLALNAAIIAAQAGDHGRGFAVVADEIKALAERTGESTKEIASLIETIQSQSRNAVHVMSRGVDDVEEGVLLGKNAEDALRNIVSSAQRSTLMIYAIAQATVEQAKGSRQVTNAIGRIAETVQQVAKSSTNQAQGAELIMKSAERMKSITRRVERSTDEQHRGGTQLSRNIEKIRETAELITTSSSTDLAGVTELDQLLQRVQEAMDRMVSLQGDLLSHKLDTPLQKQSSDIYSTPGSASCLD